jgi:hypothetical protein
VVVAIFRRWQQTRYACYLESLQNRYRPILDPLLCGTRSEKGIGALRKLRLPELEVLFDPLFAKRGHEEHHLGFLVALCTELGLVELWQSRLATGELQRRQPASLPGASAPMHALLRAKGIRNLGVLRHQPSWPLLIEALDDRHPDVQSVALRSLASIRARGSFPVLLERLQAVVLGDLPAPPRQVLLATLASFDPSCGAALLPLLRQDKWELRFIAIDILRGMVCRSAALEPNFQLSSEALAPEISDLLLTDLWRDTSAEVRGRAGEVIAFLPNPRSTTVIHKLLSDPQWYVRLHTVQALTSQRHSNALMLPGIRDCLRDSHWRVREAAIHTLIALGARGRQELYENFLISDDQLIRGQIVEVMEGTGLMAWLVAEYGEGKGGLGALMVEQLARGAAPRGLPEIIRMSPPSARQKFRERFLPYTHLQMQRQEEATPNPAVEANQQSPLEFPPVLAA